MTIDRQHRDVRFQSSEVEHEYGDQFHVQRNPVALTQLARLCSPEVDQPTFNRLLRSLYGTLLEAVVNAEFPRTTAEIPSRMAESHERGVYRGEIIDPETSVVTVDVARAGMVPSQVCFDTLTSLLDADRVRQDHVIMSRRTDDEGRVVGADVDGSKIGDSIEDRIVLLPDPMGATGSSLSTVVEYYKEHVEGRADEIVTLNAIVTPEFVQRMRNDHPEVSVYALRLDRGTSPDEILERTPGEVPERESGLDDQDYIVPGGGGFGEIMNNAWV
jgi:uracil phosphoribosyltransferase